MIDSIGNSVPASVRDDLAEWIGEFERRHGFLLEGRLSIGTHVIWFQQAPADATYPKASQADIVNTVSVFTPAQYHEIMDMIQMAFNRQAAR